MSAKEFIRDQLEKRKVLLELKNIILNKPSNELKNLNKLNINTIGEIMDTYITTVTLFNEIFLITNQKY